MPPEIWKQPKTRRQKAERAIQAARETIPLLSPLEIRSGAIIGRSLLQDGSFVYTIQANTVEGLRTFENAHELFGRQVEAIGGGRVPRVVIWWKGWTAPGWVSEHPMPSSSSMPGEGEEAETSPGEILTNLASPDLAGARRQHLIVAAEVQRFDAEQVARLEPLLRQYVHRHLNSDVREEQVAVASAIRKIIAMLPVKDLFGCEEWLKIERKTPPPLEMEVVKMITRKLKATLPEDVSPFGPLSNQLIDIFRSYLNPRTLSKRFLAATALEASLSLALLRSPHLGKAIEMLRTFQVTWFRTTVVRQAYETIAELKKRFPGDRSSDARECLNGLAEAAEAV